MLCQLQSCKCPALRAGWLLLPDANFTRVGRGVWGGVWGKERFPTTSITCSQLHSLKELGGVV